MPHDYDHDGVQLLCPFPMFPIFYPALISPKDKITTRIALAPLKMELQLLVFPLYQ